MSTAIITLPADLERLAVAKAVARGMSLEQFAQDAIRRVAELPDPWDVFADVQADVAASGVTEEELEAQIKTAIAEVRTRKGGE